MNRFLRIIGWPVTRFSAWVWRTFLDVLRRVMRDNVTGTASQFAYNAFLATIPFIFVVVTAISMAGSTAYKALFDALESTIPGINDPNLNLAEKFREATASGTAGGILIVVGAIAGLYVASNALGALVQGLDNAQRLNHRPWVRGKIINFGFAVGAMILAVVSTLLLAGRQRFVSGLARLLGGNAWIESLDDKIVLPIGVVTLFFFTLLLFRFGPNGMRLRLRWVIPGALLSVAAWVGTTTLLGLYVSRFKSFDSVYGTLGAIFVYLTFLYFSGLMFLVGAELNAELIHRRLLRASSRDEDERASEPPLPPEPVTVELPQEDAEVAGAVPSHAKLQPPAVDPGGASTPVTS